MSVFTRRAEIRELARRAEVAEAGLTEQRGELKRVRELLVDNILSVQSQLAGYTGNDYQNYPQAVQAIADKYNNRSDWGCTQTGTIIDLRAAFILGEGLQVKHTTKTKGEAEREIQWTKDFLEYNDLDGTMAQEIAKEAEIEGKCAVRVYYDVEPWRDWPGMVSARFISWLSKKYTVVTDPNDYFWYKKIVWAATATSGPGGYDEEEFVYKKFGGRITEPNEAQPKIMKCLTSVDRLDKALRDLREINHLFASPTPDFQMENAQDVDAFLRKVEDTNWKIGKLIAHTGTFTFKGPDSAGVINLISEIEMCVKMISGATGIPIHFLGLLDLLKNRATGDNTRELVMAATTRERQIWTGFFNELVDKAMAMYNGKANAQKSRGAMLDPDRVKVTIPLISQEHWDRLEKVYIPAVLAGILSKEFVASQVPGVDAEAEDERRKQAEEENAEKAMLEVERLRAESAKDKAGVGGVEDEGDEE